jgi:hypothetical protein
MKNFNWGHGIFIFYVIFVATLVVVLIAALNVDNSLVVDKYYEQDLDYQNILNKKNNSNQSKNLNINLDRSTNKINFDFSPEANVQGNIHFYRADDKSLDFNLKISDTQMSHSISALRKGKWTMKVDYESKGKKYYLEKEIII